MEEAPRAREGFGLGAVAEDPLEQGVCVLEWRKTLARACRLLKESH